MRDKIKLRGRPKRKQKEIQENQKRTEFNYENNISQKVEENDSEMQKKYNEIIVNNNI